MARIFNINLYPSGGWYFRDAEGVKHVGSSLQALVNTVRAYRERNALDIGDPEMDIVNQLCARDPGYCREEVRRVPTPAPGAPRNPLSTLAQKVSSWVSQRFADRRMGRIKKVTASEAKRRAAICARCPKQLAFPSTCGGCKENVNRLAAEAVANEVLDRSLQCCSILAEWTPTSVWIDSPPEPNNDLPVECWRKLK